MEYHLVRDKKEGIAMYCPRCGQENDDQAQFCRSCGAALQKPSQEPGVQPRLTQKRILGGVGLIAGILALVGVFSPWATGYGWQESLSISAWDSITVATIGGRQIPREAWACLVLAGAVLLLVAAVSAVAAPRAKVPWGTLAIGGALAIAGSGWGLSFVTTGTLLGDHLDRGYGLYVTLAGGTLGLIGILGLRGSSRFRNRPGTESK